MFVLILGVYSVMSLGSYFLFREYVENNYFIKNKIKITLQLAILWPLSLAFYLPRLQYIPVSRRRKIWYLV